MTIVHVTPYYAPAWAWGGVVEAVTGLARAQASAGHQVRVVTTDTLGPMARGPSGTTTEDGVDVTRVPTRFPGLRARLNLSWTRGMTSAIERAIGDGDGVVVHCHETRTVEMLAAARATRRGGVPFVVSPHGTLPLDTGRTWAKRGWDARWARASWRSVSHVIALTTDEAADVEAFRRRWGLAHLERACTVVAHGIDAARYAALPGRIEARLRLGIPDMRPVILFLGRLHARKGLDLLVDACALAASRGIEAHLLVAGPDAGVRAAIASRAATRRLDSLILPGLVTGDAKLDVLAAADLFVLPAHGEGLPMAALEALAAGLPIVATPGAHLDDVALAGAGVIVERSALAIAEAIVMLVASPARRAAMGSAGRALAESAFGCDRAVARLGDVYDDVLARHAHTRARR